MVDASWGAYSRHTSEEKLDRDGRPARVWRRRQCGGDGPDRGRPSGRDRAARPRRGRAGGASCAGIVRERDGHRLVSLFLVNEQVADGGRSVPRWLCQAQLAVAAPGRRRRCSCGAQIDAIGLAPAVDRWSSPAWRCSTAASVELAVGHGVGVEVDRGSGRARPRHAAADRGHAREEVPLTEAPGPTTSATTSIREPFTAALAGARHADAQRGERRGSARPAHRRWPTPTRRGSPRRRSGSTDPAARLDGYDEHRRAITSRTRARPRDRIRAGHRRARGPGRRRGVPRSPTTRCGSSACTRSPASCAGATTR